MTNKVIHFRAHKAGEKWLESKPDAFLKDMRRIIYKLVRELGHDSTHCGNWNEESGIGIERDSA